MEDSNSGETIETGERKREREIVIGVVFEQNGDCDCSLLRHMYRGQSQDSGEVKGG